MTRLQNATSVAAFLAGILLLTTGPAWAQANGTFTQQPTLGGGNTPGESTARPGAAYVPPAGPGVLPYNADGLKNIDAYDPERDGDYTGMCMPFGFTRSMNSP